MKASVLLLAFGFAQATLAAEPTPKVSLIDRPVPSIDNLPNDHYGKLVREGLELASRTFAFLGPEVKDPKKRYAGNNLACTFCHQENAAKPYAMPWVGVSATFPQYRGREDEVSTVEERVNGCFERSLNGRPLPVNSREMKAFVTYINFLSRGIPVGADIEGAATKPSPPPNRRADLAAGEEVYKTQCTACHGDNGQGMRTGKPGDALGYVFPPLWGGDSFNTGAGMNRLLMAARFIRYNMPQGASHGNVLLTDEQAYDVAGYIVSKPRPVKANLEADFPARWNKPVDAAFPPYVDGAPADQHKYGPFPPLIETAKRLAAEHKAKQAAAEAPPK